MGSHPSPIWDFLIPEGRTTLMGMAWVWHGPGMGPAWVVHGPGMGLAWRVIIPPGFGPNSPRTHSGTPRSNKPVPPRLRAHLSISTTCDRIGLQVPPIESYDRGDYSKNIQRVWGRVVLDLFSYLCAMYINFISFISPEPLKLQTCNYHQWKGIIEKNPAKITTCCGA